jgi:phage antirepressor YoqD-like protein
MPLFFVEEDKPMMTVKEVAEATGAPERTIHDSIDRLFPGIKRNGITTHLDESQVAAISADLKKAHNTDLADTRKVAVTHLELMEKARLVMGELAAETISLRAELALSSEALALAAPKVEAFDRFLSADGTLCIMDAAKTLGQSPLKFFDKLEAAGMIFRRGKDWLPTQYYIEKAYFEVKTRTFGEGEQARITKQTRVTPKGLDGLAKLFSAQVGV